jgi:hypothetical protein
MDISKNAKFVLVILEPPAGIVYGKMPTDQWKDFLGNTPNTTPPAEGVSKIHENVWLIPLDKNMPLLMELLSRSHSRGIRSYILFLSDEPDWLKGPAVEPSPEALPDDLRRLQAGILAERR